MDYTVHGILQARILEWVAIPFFKGLPNPGIKPVSPVMAGRHFTIEPHFSQLSRSMKDSLIAQLVKNPLAMWETWVRSLDWEGTLEKGKATQPYELCSPWGCRVKYD